ncbi:LSU ribosomal protein L4P [Geoalkalibacter ferrihydriticus]|uniref:Large ribosomal subunit protein uL4 n=2 Tax=Geoalkalibacter ferrihydriticus TaxID=392333 RepID=A0A0C2EEX6_9BACT|nr:50S ribosomal protein L4 [Geoalkalibacter ferrihydriticus]KIH77143.1 50S ribosomal protein L4 [Geoalkalibacter ferrihydriticus DSM 17813]SDL32683.1 LSU ribosomal protein L4P [Geoalkalibacter ferrihydriticus]
MATVPVFDINKNKVSDLEISDDIFNADVKEHLIHQMVRYQRASWRQGTAKTKGRSEVSGGGKKPYRQKGTGNARQGTIRAPHFVGGGTAFGPKPRDYQFKLNRKVKKAALRCALSARFKEERMTVLSAIELEKISTKAFADVLKRFELDGALVVIDEANPVVELSARNLPSVKVLRAEGVNVYDLMKHRHLVLTEGAVSQLEGALQI